MNGWWLQLQIVGPAFAAGLVVLSTHAPLGAQVLARGIIFIDLAIAQVASLGVLVGDGALGGVPAPWSQAFAYGAALAAALLLQWTERRWRPVQEAIIGVAFALAASGGVLLLARDPQGGEHLREMLVGQILWVDLPSLAPVALLYTGLIGLWLVLPSRVRGRLFYPLFAVAVTASVQLVGVLLVFATLIIPALAVRATRRHALAKSYAIGAAGYAGGLLLSAAFDLPAGAVIVWSLAAVALLFGLVSHRGGGAPPHHAPAPGG